MRDEVDHFLVAPIESEIYRSQVGSLRIETYRSQLHLLITIFLQCQLILSQTEANRLPVNPLKIRVYPYLANPPKVEVYRSPVGLVSFVNHLES